MAKGTKKIQAKKKLPTRTQKGKRKKSSTTKKAKSRRSRDELAALNPGLNLKTRTDLIDYDYVDKLSYKEKLWLAKFTEEYTNDSFNRKDLQKNLVAKNKKRRKQCDDMNNARNRCIWTRQKASGQGEYLEENKDLMMNPEEEMNRGIDSATDTYHEEYNILKESKTKTLIKRKSKK